MNNMNTQLPTILDNPKGLHQRYLIRKIVPTKAALKGQMKDFNKRAFRVVPIDSNSEYFIMRVDGNGKDKIHQNACRKAVCFYAELIKDHLPELSKDLIERYSESI